MAAFWVEVGGLSLEFDPVAAVDVGAELELGPTMPEVTFNPELEPNPTSDVEADPDWKFVSNRAGRA